MTRLALLTGCIFLFAAGCYDTKPPVLPTNSPTFAAQPKNIILLIGDGMALAQVSADVYWLKGRSVFEQFPVVGFHKSHSYDDLTTDSAAGATAFACGCKTKNNVIGLDAHLKPCQTIFEFLKQKKKYATGIAVTCSAVHATPASFVAHQEMRASSDEIAADLLKNAPDIFIGGGSAYFNDRPDARNLIDSLKKKGYAVCFSESMHKIPTDGKQPYFQFVSTHEPATASAGRTYLPKAVERACQFLKNASPHGFIFLVEGSQIDWALHANDKYWLKAEMLDFDAAIRKALEFAHADRQTLVLVTGDHECGGMSLTAAEGKKNFTPSFTTRQHTCALVPVFAYGPGAEVFSGIYENTELHRKMLSVLE